jgi:ubiquinone/menaquinone biosynthesis C-methylase UbiE
MIERSQARMFNRKASHLKNRPDRILEILKLQSGQKIADIGAGGGYFSLRFAQAVGAAGRVYAVDTNAKFLEFIEEQARESGYTNVKTILAGEDRLELPERGLDMVFMRNVCHHLHDRTGYFVNVRRTLKPSGRVAIIEYHPGRGFSLHRAFGHYVPDGVIVEEMRESGYRLREFHNFLPEQSFTIYSLELRDIALLEPTELASQTRQVCASLARRQC